ncbi:MAG: hypothetical protein GVY29_11420 [Spirochaetes bacterium]|jgi:hypothetical protein|nr:hypothetical protein [Spirochaetota bacterium]
MPSTNHDGLDQLFSYPIFSKHPHVKKLRGGKPPRRLCGVVDDDVSKIRLSPALHLGQMTLELLNVIRRRSTLPATG